MKSWNLLLVWVLVMTFGLMGCVSETGDLAELSATGGTAGSAGEAGSGGSGGGETGGTGGTETGGTGATGGIGGTGGTGATGGTGGASPECEPEGAMRDCECPDGTSGTQECVDGEYEQCVCEYYPDEDGDEYGDAEADPVTGTNPPSGHVGNNDDCDDGNASSYPGAKEVCDGEDNDCDGQVDEGDVCGSPQTWYEDSDDDSYGNPDRTKVAVQKPAGYVSIAGDCDDTDPDVHPGATEVCTDDIDNNCNDKTDCEDSSCASHASCQSTVYTFYRDADGDEYTTNETMTSTNSNPPSGWRAQKSDELDCNDNDSGVHPDAVEVCNQKDDDCDGLVDEDNVCGSTNTKVTVKYEVDCEAQTWAQSPQPEGSWAGRAYGPLTGCVSTGTRKTACTFEIPAPDFPTFVGQGFVGFGRYAGDGSGNAPAPCVTPSQVDAMQGHAITLLCTVRLWKDGVPMQQRWESNGVMKPSGTQSCEASGSFPYYNSRPVQ